MKKSYKSYKSKNDIKLFIESKLPNNMTELLTDRIKYTNITTNITNENNILKEIKEMIVLKKLIHL